MHAVQESHSTDLDTSWNEQPFVKNLVSDETNTTPLSDYWEAADGASKQMTSLSFVQTPMSLHLKRGLSLLNISSIPVTSPSRGSCASSFIDDALQVASLRGSSKVGDAPVISNPTRRSNKKRVHFDLSQNMTYQQGELDVISEEERRAAWYTREEHKAMIVNFRDAVKACRESQGAWIKDLFHLVVYPCNQSLSNRLDDTEMQLAVQSMRSDYRGMETDLVPRLFDMRRRHKARVLDYMEKIPSNLPEELKGRMLAARSLQFSRPHKLFAEVAGYADEVFSKDF